mgnify:CR=1 FL=1
MSFMSDMLIYAGGFIGVFCSIIVKYGIRNRELKKSSDYVMALILGFIVFVLYYYLNNSKLIPELHILTLIGIAVFIGFALDEITREFVFLINKSREEV